MRLRIQGIGACSVFSKQGYSVWKVDYGCVRYSRDCLGIMLRNSYMCFSDSWVSQQKKKGYSVVTKGNSRRTLKLKR